MPTAVGVHGFPGVGAPDHSDVVRRVAVLLRAFLEKVAQVFDFGSFGEMHGSLPAIVACVEQVLQKFRGCSTVHSVASFPVSDRRMPGRGHFMCLSGHATFPDSTSPHPALQ
ncbi:MAG: hypothetical protein ACXW2G_06190 [Burkholderiaceae bacterium]